VADRLTLYFDGATAAWIDDSGGVSRGSLSDAARVAAGAEVVALLPGEQVRLCRVALPPIRQATRRLQAARFALEDQLAGRVENLHFALAARSADDGRAIVAVVDLELMQQYCSAFDAVGLDVVQILPDMLALPEPAAGSWQVAVFDDRVLARTQATDGMVCDADLWPIVAQTSEPIPETLVLHAADRSQADAVIDEVDWLTAPEREDVDYTHDDGPLGLLLSSQSARAPIVNLRQGAFARQSQMNTWWRPLALTAGLAATWLVLAIASRSVELIQLNNRIDALDQQSLTAFKDAFPDVENINDLRVQAEEGIQSLRGSGSAGGIFPLLQATAAVTGPTEDLSIQSLVYRNGELDLSLSGKNVQSVETLRAGFAQQRGASLSVQSADANSAGVQIRASVSGAAS